MVDLIEIITRFCKLCKEKCNLNIKTYEKYSNETKQLYFNFNELYQEINEIYKQIEVNNNNNNNKFLELFNL